MAKNMTEDQVRDEARKILGFDGIAGVVCDVGQLTTFNQLGFPGVTGKPDGWYFPTGANDTALVLEVKGTHVKLGQSQMDELAKNVDIVKTRYSKVIGVLYNGLDTMVYRDGQWIDDVHDLQNKEHYLALYDVDVIDKERIYDLTARINNCLHFQFGIKDLYHRMIFTACALVAERYGAELQKVKDMGYAVFHTRIHTVLAKSLAKSRNQNSKIDLLLEVYSEIRMNIQDNQDAINDFIGWVCEISECINSSSWHGEDVMAIFFNEFNRYKGKTESGQVFTPEHITGFMYHLIDVHKDDHVLDAACGSGAFLVKAMSYMIDEAGGIETEKAKRIKCEQLFGIDSDRQIYALACANMLIHKDGKTNLEQFDSRSEKAGEWIASKGITKVLMNPPFENKYGCVDIVSNVLESVPPHTDCAFIMPDKKLEKVGKAKVDRMLKKHRLRMIVKLPENTFFGIGITASIFMFEAGVPQNGEAIFGCYIAEDGLMTIKNKGRMDLRGNWPPLEEYWLDVIKKRAGDATVQWIDPSEHLSYQMPAKSFEVRESDCRRAVLDYLIFQDGLDAASFRQSVLDRVLYGGGEDG